MIDSDKVMQTTRSSILSLDKFPTNKNIDDKLRRIPQIANLPRKIKEKYKQILAPEIKQVWIRQLNIPFKELLKKIKEEKMNIGSIDEYARAIIDMKTDEIISEVIKRTSEIPTPNNISKQLIRKGYLINKPRVKDRIRKNPIIKKYIENKKIKLVIDTILNMSNPPNKKNIAYEFEKKYGKNVRLLGYGKVTGLPEVINAIKTAWKQYIYKQDLNCIIEDLKKSRTPNKSAKNEFHQYVYMHMYRRIDEQIIFITTRINGRLTRNRIVTELKNEGCCIGMQMLKKRIKDNIELKNFINSKKNIKTKIIGILQDAQDIPTVEYITNRLRKMNYDYSKITVSALMANISEIKNETRVAVIKVLGRTKYEEICRNVTTGKWKLRYKHCALACANNIIQQRLEIAILTYVAKMKKIPITQHLAEFMRRKGFAMTNKIILEISKRPDSQIRDHIQKQEKLILNEIKKIIDKKVDIECTKFDITYEQLDYWKEIDKHVEQIRKIDLSADAKKIYESFSDNRKEHFSQKSIERWIGANWTQNLEQPGVKDRKSTNVDPQMYIQMRKITLAKNNNGTCTDKTSINTIQPKKYLKK